MEDEHPGGMAPVIRIQTAFQGLEPIIDGVWRSVEQNSKLFGCQALGRSAQDCSVQFGQVFQRFPHIGNLFHDRILVRIGDSRQTRQNSP